MLCLLVLATAAGMGRGSLSAQAAPQETRTTLSVATRQVEAHGTDQREARTVTTLTAHVTDGAGQLLQAQNGSGDLLADQAVGAFGTVSFDTPRSSLGATIVDAHGDATLSVSLAAAPDAAALSVRAVYHPALATDGAEQNLAGSVSGATTIEADASGVPDFTISVTPSSVTAAQGQFATTLLTVTPLNGFNEQVTLSCAGQPAQVTCNFSPVIASTASGAFTSTLQVQTQSAAGSAITSSFGLGRGGSASLAWLLPGAFVLAGFASLRRRALRGWAASAGVVLLASATIAALSGCSARYGYNHHAPAIATGTPLGTFTLTIDAAGNDGSAVTTHSLPLILQVK